MQPDFFTGFTRGMWKTPEYKAEKWNVIKAEDFIDQVKKQSKAALL
jgi:hypothetical protein